ncbi:MlaD family protein [Patulibacter defluvii]|uniref:MlaD family protein n=1 Tax=Patulibacter defluvii TaxID=3095358 RepID=UPI002A748787|nr:MlaD family protein [Patulibacter sp. DM4]
MTGRRRSAARATTAERVRSHVRWGAAVVLLALLAGYVIFQGPLPGSSPRELRVLTRDAGSLRVGRAIMARVAGVNVGYIAAIEPRGADGTTEITVRLDDDAPVIRRDATVEIRPRLFLEGNFFLDIAPGTPGAPPLGDGALPASATTIHVASDELFRPFDRATRERIRTGLSGLGGTFADGGAARFGRLLRALPAPFARGTVVADAFSGGDPSELRALVRRAGAVLDTTARHEAGLRAALRGGRRTFAALAAEAPGLRETLTELDRLTAAAPADLARIDRAVPGARALIGDARPLVRRLPRTLDRAEPALAALLATIRGGRLQALLAALRPTLATTTAAAPQLGADLAALTPIARCVRGPVLGMLNQRLEDGRFTSGMPYYREFLAGLPGGTSAASLFDGAGGYTNLLAGLGGQLLTAGSGDGRPSLAVGGGGSSPPRPAQAPPMRTDVACDQQRTPVLRARAVPLRGTVRTATVDPAAVRRALRAPARGEDDVAARLRRTLRDLLGATDGEAGR